MQGQQAIVRFLSDCEGIWHRRYPELHRRAQWHIVAHLCTTGRDGAALGELSGIVKQVFLLDDATVRDRITELADLGLCEFDPAGAALSARTIVMPTETLLASFDAYLRELATRVQAAAAIHPPHHDNELIPLDDESRRSILAVVERCRDHIVSALEQFFDKVGLSRARRLDARRHALSSSHWGLILLALSHHYASPAATEDADGVLADHMAAALLTQIGQNLQTTRDHIGYLLQLGLLERRSGRALRVALAKPAGEPFDQELAKAAEELPLLARRLRTASDNMEQTTTKHITPAVLASNREVEHTLLVRRSGEADREVPIGPEPVVIGRAPASGIVLAAPEVSRMHCRIDFADARATATDLNSTNGTLLNDKPLERTTVLAPDSVLQIGPYRLEYRRRGAPDPEATVRARDDLHQIASLRSRRHGT
jgi:hypothetical protein